MPSRLFCVLLAGAFLSNIGSWMQVIAQGWLVAQLSHEPRWSALVSLCAGIPMLLFSLPGGVISDRFSRRAVVIVCQGILMTNALILAALTQQHLIQIWHVAAISFLSGTAIAVNNPAYSGLLLNIAGQEGLQRALSLNASQFQLSRIVGPALAGAALGLADIEGCFFANAFSFVFLIPILFVIPLRLQQDLGGVRSQSFRNSVEPCIRFACSHSSIRKTLAVMCLASLFLMPHVFFLPLYVQKDLGLSPQVLGTLWMVSALGAFCASLIFEIWRRRKKSFGPEQLTWGALVGAVGMAVFANARSLPIAYGFIFLSGVGTGLIFVGSQFIIQNSTPAELQGRLLGLCGTLFQGMFPVGVLLVGLVAQATSLSLAWTAFAIAMILAMGGSLIHYSDLLPLLKSKLDSGTGKGNWRNFLKTS